MAALGDPRPVVVPRGRRPCLLKVTTMLIGASIAVEVLVLLGVLHQYLPPSGQSGMSFTWRLGTTSPSAGLSLAASVLMAATVAAVLTLLTRAYTAAGDPGGRLPVRRVWFVISWFVPCVSLFAPYPLMRFTFDRLLGEGSRQLLNWWWATWVLSSAGLVFWSSTGDDRWQTPTRPFAMWEAATDVAFGLMTLMVLRRLATARSTSPSSPGSP